MRNLDTIDRELRLLSIVRTTLRAEYGAVGTSSAMDRLLDERLAAHDKQRQSSIADGAHPAGNSASSLQRHRNPVEEI